MTVKHLVVYDIFGFVRFIVCFCFGIERCCLCGCVYLYFFGFFVKEGEGIRFLVRFGGLGNVCCCCCLFFFFKQKTAYEV